MQGYGAVRPTAAATVTATLTAANNKKVLATDALAGTGAPTSHIYWANVHGGTINGANLDGTGVTTLVTGQNLLFGGGGGPAVSSGRAGAGFAVIAGPAPCRRPPNACPNPRSLGETASRITSASGLR